MVTSLKQSAESGEAIQLQLGRAESHVKASVEAIEGVLRRLIDNHHEQPNTNGALSYQGG